MGNDVNLCSTDDRAGFADECVDDSNALAVADERINDCNSLVFANKRVHDCNAFLWWVWRLLGGVSDGWPVRVSCDAANADCDTDYGSADSHGSEAGRPATGPDRSDNAEEEEKVFQKEEEEGLLPLMMPLFRFWKFRSHRVVRPRPQSSYATQGGMKAMFGARYYILFV